MNIKNIILISIGLFGIYIFLGAIIPYFIPKKISKSYKDNFNIKKFYGDATSADRVYLVEKPDDAFVKRIQIINQAVNTLDMAFHTVDNAKTTDEFFSAVLNAADRGVKVRFIVEGVVSGMNIGENKNISLLLSSHKNITYKIYNRLNILKPWELNALLHDKFIISDNKFYTLGGRNIGDKCFAPLWFSGKVSLDREVLVFNTAFNNKDDTASSLYQLRKYADNLFSLPYTKTFYKKLSRRQKILAEKKNESLKIDYINLKKRRPDIFITPSNREYESITVETKKVSLINNPIHNRKKQPVVGYILRELAQSCKKSLIFQTPYATANKEVLLALTKVGKKNIDFRMLTNSTASTPNIPAFSNYILNRKKFLKTKVKIFEYQGPDASLHGKTYLFDDNITAIGSFNLDDRSIYIDTETMLVIDSPAFNKITKNTLESYMSRSLVVGVNNNYIDNNYIDNNYIDNNYIDNNYIDNKNIKELPSSFFKKVILYLASVFSRLFQFLI